MSSPVLDAIRSQWPRSFYRDEPGSGFGGMTLPFPYTSPCIHGEGHFTFFFYWDAFFTQPGLLAHGHAEMVKNNIRNMLWFIERQGYMPNHTAIFNRSQPPYLCGMVQGYLAATGDDGFLAECAEGLRREYFFWTLARLTSTGLSHYGHHDTAEGAARFLDSVSRRLGLPADLPFAEKVRLGDHYLGQAEAGCDFTPRYAGGTAHHCAVDLNALLFDSERFLGANAARVGWDDAGLWEKRAAARLERMNRYLWSEEQGFFLDYHVAEARHDPIRALTGFLALFNGVASAEQAERMLASLPLFERDHGIAYTEETPDCRRFQWAYPAVWPPLVFIVVNGLRRYGFDDHARRIAAKYVDTTDRLFARTGRLWEKTDAETGEILGAEYASAPMLGWCAGVYTALHAFLHE